jgi:NADP-dependent 3-hydroxy acid dehydrogenase YdfG
MNLMPTNRALDDQIAIVTGASGGIGSAISLCLATQGANVCLIGRDEQRLKTTADLCEPFQRRIETFTCDVSRSEDIHLLCSRVKQQFGRADILVHCAGAIAHTKLEDAPPEVLDQLLLTNVRGPMLLTQGFLPLLKRPRGQIVFINSSAVLSIAPGRGYYTATQHALRAFADTLRQEVNADEVRVLSVYPGRTATPRTERLHEKEGISYQPDVLLQPKAIAAIVLSALALDWTAEVTDITIRSMKKTY